MDGIWYGLVLARWLHFCAMFTLFGSSAWLLYDGEPAARSRTTRRLALRGLPTAATIALLTGAGWLAGTIANMTGGLDGLADLDTLHAVFFETAFGPIELARLGLLVVVVIVARAPLRDRPRLAAVAGASGLRLVSQAWLGHASEGGTSPYGMVMTASYAVHVLAGAAWLGALPVLLGEILEMRGAAHDLSAAVLRPLSRFASLATVAVCLIVATGVANTAFRVAGHALWPSRYVAVLLGKVLLVGLMLVFAGYNRFVAMPRLRRGSSDPAIVGRVATSVGCEIALGLLILAAAAVLGITPPPT